MALVDIFVQGSEIFLCWNINFCARIQQNSCRCNIYPNCYKIKRCCSEQTLFIRAFKFSVNACEFN